MDTTSINIPEKLTYPTKHYGATMGKTPLTAWIINTVLCIVFIGINFFIDRESVLAEFYLIFTTVFTLVWVFTTGHTFYHKHHEFNNDERAKRKEYALTTFKTWLEKKYSIDVDDETAYRLFDGWNASVRRENSYVTVVMRNMETVWAWASDGSEYTKSLDEPKLMLIPEEIKKPDLVELAPANTYNTQQG